MAYRFLSATLAAALVSAPAFAAPVADGASTTVRFADLDLATDAGAAALHTRVMRAARAVCGGDADQRDLDAVRVVDACRKVAMASAEPQMEVALAAARDGRQLAVNDVKVQSKRGF